MALPKYLCLYSEDSECADGIITEDTVALRLSKPGTEDICAMTLEKICSYRLEFYADAVMDKDNPELSMATLPCGHCFSALACMYYFYKVNMLCPLCRSGVPKKMHKNSIPVHIRDGIIKHTSKQNQQDRIQQEVEDRQHSIELMLNELQNNTLQYTRVNPVTCIMYTYHSVENAGEVGTSFEFQLKLCIPDVDSEDDDEEEELITFKLKPSDVRNLSILLQNKSCISMVEFAVAIRGVNDEVIFLDRSAVVSSDSISHNMRFDFPGRQGGEFTTQLIPNLRLNEYALESFHWKVNRSVITEAVQTNSVRTMT